MGRRACASGIVLSESDAAIVKGMLGRGDRQHDIAAWFGVNSGRIAEIATGFRFRHIEPAAIDELPPTGPYPAGRVAVAAITALSAARVALLNAETLMRRTV
jgi:hypothetical protein